MNISLHVFVVSRSTSQVVGSINFPVGVFDYEVRPTGSFTWYPPVSRIGYGDLFPITSPYETYQNYGVALPKVPKTIRPTSIGVPFVNPYIIY